MDTSSEIDSDTAVIQRALNDCPSGEAVELMLSADSKEDAFFVRPITLPSNVTLLIDAGVTVYATRSSHHDEASGTTPLINVGPSALPAGIMGFGVLDGRGVSPLLINAQGALKLFKLTVRNTAGAALRYASTSGLQVEDVKFASLSPATHVQAITLAPDSDNVQIRNTSLAAGAGGFVLPPWSNASVQNLSVYSEGCVVDLAPFVCLPAKLPGMTGELFATTSDSAPSVSLSTRSPVTLTAVLIAPNSAGSTAAPHLPVIFYDGSIQLGTASVSNTLAQLSLPALSTGIHHITAFYPGADLSFGAVTIVVPSITLSASGTTVFARSPVTFTAGMDQTAASGDISFTDNSALLAQATLAQGVAVTTTNSLTVGAHTISASYSGDTLDAPAQSPDLNIRVDPNPTITALAPLPSSQSFGTPVTLAATILPADAPGLITFRDNTTQTQLGQAPLVSGRASLTNVSSLSVGNHTITASYAGDTEDLPSVSAPVSTIVSGITTATSLAVSPIKAVYGAQVTVNANVTPSTATGSVTLTDSLTGVSLQLGMNGGSAAYSTQSLSPGVHSFTATYSGDATHAPSASPSASLQVDRISTSTTLTGVPAATTVGMHPVLVAAVLPTAATGTMSFVDANSGLLGQVAVSSGTATLPLPALSPGPHSIAAVYSGDTENAPSTSASTPTQVNQAPTTLSLSVPPTITYGDTPPLTATILPGTATGTVTFTDSVSGVVSSALLTNGSATIQPPVLAPGKHLLSASYSGDPLASGATSPAISLLVLPATSTTNLTLAQSPIPAGRPVIFNVQVGSVPAANPTGQIVIRGISPGGLITLASSTLTNPSSGRAYATISVDSAALGLGTFTSVIASYSGDTDDSPSISAPASFQIIASPVNAVLTLSSNQTFIGAGVTLTAKLTASADFPTGSVTFFQDGKPISTATLSGGVASTSLIPHAGGPELITATYNPTGLFASATADPELLTVTAPFSVILTPSVLSQTAPSSTGTSLVVSSLSGFSGPISTSCAVPYSYFTCAVVASTTLGAGAVVSETIHLILAPNILPPATAKLRPGSPWTITFALLVPFLARSRRRRLRGLTAVALTAVSLALTACAPGTFFDIPLGANQILITVATPGYSASTTLTVNITR